MEYFAPKLPLIFGDKLKDMNVLYIPTAAYAEEGYEEWLKPELEAVRPQVGKFTEFDVKNKTNNELEVALQDIDLLYVTGGNTYYLLEAMNQIGFKETLINFLQKGGVYMGSSAGSIVMCPDIDFVREMDEPDKASLDSTAGCALVDFAIMPHIDQPRFNNIFEKTLKTTNKGKQIIGLRDNQALWVEDNYIRVY
jgi:dipeptidase E